VSHDDTQDKQNDQALGALRSLGDVGVQPSPYMKTRVLAKVRAEKSKRPSYLKWLWPSISGALAFALLVVLVRPDFDQQNPAMQVAKYEIGQPYMLKVDLRTYEDQEIAQARIRLNDVVAFSSKRHSHIKQLKSLTLQWEQLAGKQYLPIVIEGLQSGDGQVLVEFLNDQGQVVDSTTMDLKFQVTGASS